MIPTPEERTWKPTRRGDQGKVYNKLGIFFASIQAECKKIDYNFRYKKGNKMGLVCHMIVHIARFQLRGHIPINTSRGQIIHDVESAEMGLFFREEWKMLDTLRQN